MFQAQRKITQYSHISLLLQLIEALEERAKAGMVFSITHHHLLHPSGEGGGSELQGWVLTLR